MPNTNTAARTADHEPVLVGYLDGPMMPSVYLHVFCDGCTFRTPHTKGWQARIRAWARRVDLTPGAVLDLRRVDRCLVGRPHFSVVGS